MENGNERKKNDKKGNCLINYSVVFVFYLYFLYFIISPQCIKYEIKLLFIINFPVVVFNKGKRFVNRRKYWKSKQKVKEKK